MLMYNFSVFSGLKVWIDQIVCFGVIFDFVFDNGVVQYWLLLCGKCVLIVISCGGYGFGLGGENQVMNYVDFWLCIVLGFIGIDEVMVVVVEGEEFGGRFFEDFCDEVEQCLLVLVWLV